MANLANPLIGLVFLRRNDTVFDMTQGSFNIPSFSMQFKDANISYPKNTEPLRDPHENILQAGKQTIIWVKS